MKLLDARKRFRKDIVYDTYLRIVYDAKDYDNVSRGLMIKEIVRDYHLENFMFLICTKRELEFICNFYKKKIAKKDIDRYSWEIRELDKKYIFNSETCSFYEDYDDVIPKVIDTYNNMENKMSELSVFMLIVAIVRIHAELLKDFVSETVAGVSNIDKKSFDALCGNPLVHFYCDWDIIEIGGKEIETMFYRDYYDMLDNLKIKRKELGFAADISLTDSLIKNFFYYGYNLENKNVKDIYDKVCYYYPQFLWQVEKARVLGEEVLDYIPFSKEINEALRDVPCAAMNGATPKERDKYISEMIDIQECFSSIPQNNAHVHKDIKDKFYKYYFALLEYINNKYNINSKIKKIYMQNNIDPESIVDIDNYLWHHKEIINEFIKDNPFKFKENEFKYIEEFKTGLVSSNYIFLGTDREYARFLSEDGKIYMVKGLTSDIDEVLDIKDVPKMVNTHLLMFEGYIIYNGFISTASIDFGNSFRKLVINDMKNAIKYYHF